jgi:hypothetical protein
MIDESAYKRAQTWGFDRNMTRVMGKFNDQEFKAENPCGKNIQEILSLSALSGQIWTAMNNHASAEKIGAALSPAKMRQKINEANAALLKVTQERDAAREELGALRRREAASSQAPSVPHSEALHDERTDDECSVCRKVKTTCMHDADAPHTECCAVQPYNCRHTVCFSCASNDAPSMKLCPICRKPKT